MIPWPLQSIYKLSVRFPSQKAATLIYSTKRNTSFLTTNLCIKQVMSSMRMEELFSKIETEYGKNCLLKIQIIRNYTLYMLYLHVRQWLLFVYLLGIIALMS